MMGVELTPDLYAGLGAGGLIALLVGALLFWKNKAIMLFFWVLCAVALGYLSTTGTVQEYGGKINTKVHELQGKTAATPTSAPAPAH